MQKLTTPIDVKTRKIAEERIKLIAEIEKHLPLAECEVFEDFVEVIISGEYSKNARNSVKEAYIKIGWQNVEHMCSSENHERGGLTRFRFYF